MILCGFLRQTIILFFDMDESILSYPRNHFYGADRLSFRIWLLWFSFLIGIMSGVLLSPAIPIRSFPFSASSVWPCDKEGFIFLSMITLGLPSVSLFLSAFSLIGWLFLPGLFFLRGLCFCFSCYCLYITGNTFRQIFLLLGIPSLFWIPAFFFLGEGALGRSLSSFSSDGNCSVSSDDFVYRTIVSILLIAVSAFIRSFFLPLLDFTAKT